MLPEIGLFLLIISACFALVLAGLGYGCANHLAGLNQQLKNIRVCAIGLGAVLSFSFLILLYAFFQADFSVQLVAKYSHSSLPWGYRMASSWGSVGGSLLLFCWLFSVWSLRFTLLSNNMAEQNNTLSNYQIKTLSYYGMVQVILLTVLLVLANPFKRFLLDIPIDGADLNPLLQDPAMLIHPPVLYLGYTGLLMAGLELISGLICAGGAVGLWVGSLRKTVKWGFLWLSLGIILGSLWAYYELGWGGFWFWDPVENASLLPWLSCVAWLHALVACQKKQTGYRLMALLGLSTFLLVWLGLFLVRSGFVTSVHSFAPDTRMGICLGLVFVMLCVFSVRLLLNLNQLPKNTTYNKFSWSTQTGALLGQSVLWAGIAVLVLVGTLYPLLYFFYGRAMPSVGPGFYNQTVIYLVFPLCLWMLFVPYLSDSPVQAIHNTHNKGKKIFYLLGLFSYGLMGVSLWLFAPFFSIKIWLISGLLFWIMASSFMGNELSIGSKIAHSGMMLLLLSVFLVSSYGVEREYSFAQKDKASVGGYDIILEKIRQVDGQNYVGHMGEFIIKKSGRELEASKMMYPEKRFYFIPETAVSEVALLPIGFGVSHLYIALSSPLNNNRWAVKLYYKPFVNGIWLGGLLVCVGVLLSFFRKKQLSINKNINKNKSVA